MENYNRKRNHNFDYPYENDIDSLNFLKTKTENITESAIKQISNYSHYSSNPLLIDDQVFAEAQGIVKSWMTTKKVYGDFEDRNSYLRLSSEENESIKLKIPTKVEIHREWEHLLNRIESEEDLKGKLEEYSEENHKDLRKDRDFNEVMQSLRKKTFVNKSRLRNVDSPKTVDYQRKMENRQEEVRKRREENLRMEQQRKLEKLAEKEARLEVCKREKEGKKLQEITAKKEEELIKMEMKRIRSEMQKQKEHEYLELTKKEDLANAFRNRFVLKKYFKIWVLYIIKIKEEKTYTDAIKRVEEKKTSTEVLLKRQNELKIIEQKKKIEVANLFRRRKLMQQYFILWRLFIMDIKEARLREQALEKEKNISKLELTSIKSELQLQRQRELEILELQRKEKLADSFRRNKLLKMCLIEWSLFVIDAKESRWCQKLEEMRKKKMASYIDALQEKIKENERSLQQLNDLRISSEQIQVEEVVKNPVEDDSQIQQRQTTTSDNSGSKPRRIEVPKLAWQVTRKHVNIPIESLVDIDMLNETEEKPKFKSLKKPKVVDQYAHRNTVQKEIIEKQKEKIREQEKMLEDLRCNELLTRVKAELGGTGEIQIIDNPHQSAVSTKRSNENESEDNPVSPTGTIDGEIQPSDPNSVKKNLKKNKFVIQMEERAKERERIKAERLEKKRQAEEENKKRLVEQMAEQARLEAEQKAEREKQLKEKRMKEKQKEEQKRKKRQQEQELNSKADAFYHRLLLKKFGVKRWSLILEIKRKNLEKALLHYKLSIERKIFAVWYSDFQTESRSRNEMIFNFYTRILLKKCFHCIKMYKHRAILMAEQAHSHYLHSLLSRYFQNWRIHNHRQQIRMDKMAVEADELYNKHLLRSAFAIWKEIPMEARKEKEREKRIRAMKDKVSSILPDFKVSLDDLY